MTHVLVPAPSLTVGEGFRTLSRTSMHRVAGITMNFPLSFAEKLVDRIFRPYARPENFIAAIDHARKIPEVALYCIVDTPKFIALPGYTLVLPPASPPFRYIIGNEVDIEPRKVREFEMIWREQGKLFVACGNHNDANRRSTTLMSWWIELSVIHQGPISPLLAQRATNTPQA